MSDPVARNIFRCVEQGFVDPDGEPGNEDDVRFGPADGVLAIFRTFTDAGVAAGKCNPESAEFWGVFSALCALAALDLAEELAKLWRVLP